MKIRNTLASWRHQLALAIGFICLVSIPSAHAINASPHNIETAQPDGARITLRIHGDERFNWQSDTRGYTVVRDNGRYVYAQRGASGQLVPTTLEVGKADPAASGFYPRRRRSINSAPVPRTRRAAVHPRWPSRHPVAPSRTWSC